MSKLCPDQSFLKECFVYNEVTGNVYWKNRPIHHFKCAHRMNQINSRFSGKKTGTINKDGYLQIRISGKLYMAHRLIWKLYYGYDPSHELDHINGNPSDNRIQNLRECNRSQNVFNKKTIKNTRGITIRGKKYLVRIGYNGKRIRIGVFDTLQEAQEAYNKKSIELYGTFVRE